MFKCIISVIHWSFDMILKLSPSTGTPVYLQIMQQIRHAIDTGVLEAGDSLPAIRTLAADLVVSPNTVAKAYSELQHEGSLELRHGSGAYVATRRGAKSRAERVCLAQERVQRFVEDLRQDGLSDEEIHRLFEAELFYSAPAGRRR